MKTRILLFASLVICAMASPAFAAGALVGGFHTLDPYVGASIGLLRYDQDHLPTFTPSALLLRAGVPLDSFFALEARVGTGLSSDNRNGNDVGFGTYWGAYAKGSLALSSKFSAYAVAGLASVHLNRNFGAGDSTNTGVSGGVGGDVQLEPALDFNFEWTFLPSPSQGSSNLISVGFNYFF